MNMAMAAAIGNDVRQQVHNVLWDWAVLRVSQGSDTDERLELVRTLHRLASSAEHARALLTVWKTVSDVRVQTTLSWACFQFLSSKPVDQSQAIVQESLPLLRELLQDACLPRRLACCEMVSKLHNIGFVPENVLASLDAAVADILEAAYDMSDTSNASVANVLEEASCYPVRSDRAVEAVMRYFTLRPPTVAGPPVDRFLPCGGMAWRMAMEYLARRDAAAAATTTLTVMSLAPVPSSVYETRHVVGTLSHVAQTAFVTMASAIPLAHANDNGPTLYLLMDALHYCFKAVDALPCVVPQTIRVMDTMGEQVAPEYSIHLWETGWGILETVMSYPRSAARVAPYLPDIFGLLRRLPQAHTFWNRFRVRRVLSDAYEHCPEAFDKVDWASAWMWPCTLEVIPDKLLRQRMEYIVLNLVVHSCSLYGNGGGNGSATTDTDMACLRLICRMNEAEQAIHSEFVASHAETLHKLLVASESDLVLRFSVRDMLPVVPLTLFSACVPTVASMISADQTTTTGLLAVCFLPSERLVAFQTPLFHRVFDKLDIYSDELQASLALGIMTRLPLDVLRPVALALVYDSSATAALSSVTALALEDRLFVLRHLPCNAVLEPEDVKVLADLYLCHDRVVVSQLTMEVVVATRHAGVCEEYAGWSMDMLKTGPTTHVRALAHKMLLCMSGPVLLKALQTHGLADVQGYFVCKLLDRLDSTFLPPFLRDILRVCDGNKYAQLPMELLARMPLATLYEHQQQVLAVLENRSRRCGGMRWDASRKVLRALAIAGATLAKDMLWEQRYTYTMAS